jgi:hypothetical protein
MQRRLTKLRILATTDEGGTSPTTGIARNIIRKTSTRKGTLIRKLCLTEIPQEKTRITDEEWNKKGYGRLANPGETKTTSMWNSEFKFIKNYINNRYPGANKTCRRCKTMTHCYVKHLEECEHTLKGAILQETEQLRTTKWTELPKGFKKKLNEGLRRLLMDSI